MNNTQIQILSHITGRLLAFRPNAQYTKYLDWACYDNDKSLVLLALGCIKREKRQGNTILYQEIRNVLEL